MLLGEREQGAEVDLRFVPLARPDSRLLHNARGFPGCATHEVSRVYHWGNVSESETN
jgi:hypothetical protein